MSWYLRSLGDRDTHRGQWSGITRSVHAVCGIEFQPSPIRTALPGAPPDPNQACPQCYRAKDAR